MRWVTILKRQNFPAFASTECCEHHHQDRGDLPNEQPDNCCVHCEGTCVYTLPQKVQPDSPLVLAWANLELTTPSITIAHVQSASWLAVSESKRAAEPPLRLHLLHQLLLI